MTGKSIALAACCLLALASPGLAGTPATVFVDELGQRQVSLDLINRVLIQNQDAKAALTEAAKTEQAILDRFYK